MLQKSSITKRTLFENAKLSYGLILYFDYLLLKKASFSLEIIHTGFSFKTVVEYYRQYCMRIKLSGEISV